MSEFSEQGHWHRFTRAYQILTYCESIDDDHKSLRYARLLVNLIIDLKVETCLGYSSYFCFSGALAHAGNSCQESYNFVVRNRTLILSLIFLLHLNRLVRPGNDMIIHAQDPCIYISYA